MKTNLFRFKNLFTSTVLALSLIATQGFAQVVVTDYGLKEIDSVYEPLTGGIKVPGIVNEDGSTTNINDTISSVLTLPFPFSYSGFTYNSVKVSTNGFIILGNTGASNYNNNIRTGQVNTIAPLWDDLKINDAKDMTYDVIGDEPNRQFIVQWKNVQWVNDPNSTENFATNFQVRLFERSNNIEFWYGATSPKSSTQNLPIDPPVINPSASIGIIGQCNGQNNFLQIIPGAGGATTQSAQPLNASNVPQNTPLVANNSGIANGKVFRLVHPIISVAGGSWDFAPIWSQGRVPTAGDVVVIANGTEVTIPANYMANCKKLLIGNTDLITDETTTATLTLSEPTGKLTVNGDVRMSTAEVKAIPGFNTNDYARLYVIGGAEMRVNGSLEIAGLNGTVGGFALMPSIVTVGAASKLDVRGSVSKNVARGGCSSILTGFVEGANDRDQSKVILSSGNGTLLIGGSLGANFLLDCGTSGSTVHFNGSGSQVVGQTGIDAGFYNLRINNSVSVTLGVPVNTFNLFIGDEKIGTVVEEDGKQIAGDQFGKMTMGKNAVLRLGHTSQGAGLSTGFPTNFRRSNITLDSSSTVEYRANRDQEVSAEPVYGNVLLKRTNGSGSANHKLVVNRTIIGSITINKLLKVVSTEIPATFNTSGAETSNDGNGHVNVRFTDAGISVTNSIGSIEMTGSPKRFNTSSPPAETYAGNFPEISYIGTKSAAFNVMGTISNVHTHFVANDGPANVIWNMAGNVSHSRKFTIANQAGHTTVDMAGSFTNTGDFIGSNLVGNTTLHIKGNFSHTGTFFGAKDAGNLVMNLDSNFTNSGPITFANAGGKADVTIKRDYTNDGTFILSNGEGNGTLTITEGSFVKNGNNALTLSKGSGESIFDVQKGHFTINSGTGNSPNANNINILNAGNADSAYLHVKGNLTKKEGTFTVSTNGKGSLRVEGTTTNETNTFIVAASAVNSVLRTGHFTLAGGTFTATNAVGDPVITVDSNVNLTAGTWLGSTNNDGLPVTTINGDLNINGASFYALDNATTGPAANLFATYAIKGNVNITSGLFLGTKSKNPNVFNIGGNVNLSGGTFACSQQFGVSVPTTSDTTGNAQFNIGGDVTVTGGNMYLTQASSTSAGGGHCALNIQGSMTVSKPGRFMGVMGSPGKTNYRGKVVFANPGNSQPEHNMNLNPVPFRTGVDTAQYNIIVESLRSVRMVNDVCLGSNKSLTVLGKLLTNNYIVKNTGTDPSVAMNTAFRLKGNGYLDITSVDGITESDPSGSIQTDNRYFSDTAVYSYTQTAATQAMGDGIPSLVKDLRVNTPALQMIKDITIRGFLRMDGDNNYLVIETGKKLIFQPNALPINMSKTRFVRGRVEKQYGAADNSFTFPVGDNLTYYPMTITKTTDNPTISARFSKKNPSEDGFYIYRREPGIEGVSFNYYYDVRRSAGSQPVNITLNYDPHLDGILKPDQLSLVYYKTEATESNSKWRLASSDASKTTNDTTNGIITTQGFNSFSTLPDSLSTPINLAGKVGSENFAGLEAIMTADKLTPCAKDTVTFRSISTGFPTGFSWNFGSGATPSSSTKKEVKVVFSSSGAKDIYLKVTRGGGTESDDSTSTGMINVQPLGPIEAFASAPTSVCKGDTKAYILSTGNAGDQYVWSANNGASIVSGQGTASVDIRFPNTGSVQILVYKTNPASQCRSNVRSVSVSVNTPNIGNMAGDTATCSNATEAYTVNADAAATFKWEVLSGGTIVGSDNGNSVNVTWTAGGKHSIKLTKTKTFTGPTCSEEKILQVNVADIDVLTNAAATICHGQSQQLTATTKGAVGSVTYKWKSSPAGFASNLQNPTAKPAVTTTYTVVAEDNGCIPATKDSASVTITVRDSITAAITADDSICAEKSKQLQVAPSGGMGSYTYQWSPVEGLSDATIANPVATPESTTTYSVTISDGCSTPEVKTVKVTVRDVIQATTSPDTIACVNSEVTLRVNPTGGLGFGYTYSWVSEPAGFTSTQQNPVVHPDQHTVYTVTISEGCSPSITRSVDVDVYPLVVADAGADITACVGDSIELNGYATGGLGTYTYSWASIPAGFTSNKQKVRVEATDTIRYELTITDNCSPVAKDTLLVIVNPLPEKPEVTGADTVCAGSAITLTSSIASSYQWFLNGQPVENENSSEYTFIPADKDSVFVMTGNGLGCYIASDTVEVNTKSSPAKPVVTGNQPTCAGSELTLSTDAGFATYQWYVDGVADANGKSGNFTFKPANGAKVTVSVGNALGCIIASDTTIVLVNPLPTVDAGENVAICAKDSIQLSATGADTYSWTPADGLSNPNIANPKASPAASTKYYVTGTDAKGCYSIDSVTVTINTLPVVNAGADVTICRGESAQLNATGAVIYQWDPVTGLDNPNIANPKANPLITTTYTVTGTGANGCRNTDKITVTVNGKPPVPTISGNKPICQGDDLKLTSSASDGNQWYKNNQPQGGEIDKEYTFKPKNGDKVFVEVTVNGCSSRSLEVTITVRDTPNVDFTVVPDPHPDSVVNFTASGALTYEWDFGDTNTGSGESVNHTYAEKGVYKVRLVGTDANGCKSVIEKEIGVWGVGMETYKKGESIKVYPNPSNGAFTIRFTGLQDGTYRITLRDIHGRTVEARNTTVSGSVDMDYTHVAPGLYFIQVEGKDFNKFERVEIIKE